MPELARKTIPEHIARREQGEDAAYPDLGRCRLIELPRALKHYTGCL